MTFDPHDPGLHDGSKTGKRPANLPDAVTSHTVLAAFAAKLTELDDRNVRLGGRALSLEDPRVIAGQLARQADLLRVSTILRPTDGTDPIALAYAVGAQVVALCLSIARADEMRVDSGDAA